MSFDTRYREVIEDLFREAISGFSEAKEFCLGPGKRLRPQLLLDAANVWGAPDEEAESAAIGVELLHEYFLVHDDLMDNDLLRRGQPTLPAAVIARYGELQGRGLAIAIGDYLAHEAFRHFEPRIADIALNATRDTILGQLREYVPSSDWTREDLENFYAYKTSAYSLKLPWHIADVLSGTNVHRSTGIEAASRELGIAYQFHDDLIEFEGKKKRDAKGETDDLARGKMTILTRLLFDELEEDKRNAPTEDLRREIRVRKIPERVKEMIQERVHHSQDFLMQYRLAETPSVKMLLEFLKS